MILPKLLLVTSAIPAQTTGGCMLDLSYLQFLSQHYQIHLVHFRDDNQSTQSTVHLAQYCQTVTEVPHIAHQATPRAKLTRFLSIYPRYWSLIDHKFVESEIAKLIESNHISTIFCTSMWANALIPAKYHRSPKNHTLCVNVEYRLLQSGSSFKNKWDALRTRVFEKNILSRQTHLAALTNTDAQELSKFSGKILQVCPPFLAPKPIKTNHDARGALLTTNLTFEPNRISFEWLIQQVLPLLPSNFGITVAGKDHDDILVNAAKKYPNINYTGFLDDAAFEQLFATHRIVINPTIVGSGFQIKTLEAISRGKILISTAFSNHLGSVIASSDDPIEFAKLMLEFESTQTTGTFNYTAFYRDATAKLLAFFQH